MMKYFILILLFISCADSITQSEETAILQTILNTSEFKKYHHPNLKNRIPLFLLDKGQFSNTNLSQVKPKVKIVDDTTGTNGNYIKFSKLFISDGEAEFELYYKIENMHMGGSLTKKEGEWQIDEIDYVIET